MPTFTLDSSRLAIEGLLYAETIAEDRGRSVQLSWVQGNVNEDLELLGFGIRFAVAEPEAKDTSV